MNFSPAEILRVSQGDYIHPGRPGIPNKHRFNVTSVLSLGTFGMSIFRGFSCESWRRPKIHVSNEKKRVV